MRGVGILAGLMLAALPIPVGGAAEQPVVPPASARPMRVMSMNTCTDQLVLALLPPQRIASVTWLARDPDMSLMVARTGGIATNHGLAEEVLRQRPDLIVTGVYTAPATRAMLKRLDYPMIEVPEADSFDQIRAVTRQVAAAVGEPARGEAMIARMDRQLAALSRDNAPAIRVAAWDGDGFSANTGSLYASVLRLAGARNVAEEPLAAGHGAADMELLLATAPTLLIQGAPGADRPGLRDLLARHRLVRRYWHDRIVNVRPAYYICGTPFIADAALDLRNALRRAAATARAPLPFARGAGS